MKTNALSVGGKKMPEDLADLNLIFLEKEFHAIGLPRHLNETLYKEIKELSGEKYILSFSMQIGCLAVRGEVHLEPNGEGGMYTTSFYTLTAENVQGVGIMQNAFLYSSLAPVTVEEAVNLMQDRCVYRKPSVDLLSEGYWVYLAERDLASGFRQLLFVRNGFRVREYLVETGLGSWLGVEGWEKLVRGVENGDRCQLAIGTGKGMRDVKVEADPLRQRLKVEDETGMEVTLTV